MKDSHPLRPHVDSAELADRLRLYFDFGRVLDLSFVYGGFMCHNYRLETECGTFFLKQYRNKISTIVHEIKHAEEFFAHHDLPVLIPIRDRFGRSAFWLNGHWISLFPFITDRRTPAFSDIDISFARQLGDLLGKFHVAGRVFEDRHFQPLQLWDRRKFMMEYIELEQVFLRRDPLSDLEKRMAEILSRKVRFVQTNTKMAYQIQAPYDSLLHGDFIYNNLFMDNRKSITDVYDLEKTCIGPSCYELARSLIINCFDNGLSEKNFELGRTFLQEYQRHIPLSFETFVEGVNVYRTQLFHMDWIEARYLVYGIDSHLDLYERHAQRIEWMLDSFDGFCEKVFPEVFIKK